MNNTQIDRTDRVLRRVAKEYPDVVIEVNPNVVYGAGVRPAPQRVTFRLFIPEHFPRTVAFNILEPVAMVAAGLVREIELANVGK